MPNAKLKSYLHFHVIVFIWGFTAVLGALISIKAIPLVWFRMGLATLFIAGYMYAKGISFKMSTLSRKQITTLIIGGVIIAVHWLTFFGAIKAANVAVTLAMMSTGAFFTALLEPIFYKRKLIWYELVFGGLVIGALYFIFEVETSYRLGIGLALLSAFLSAVFTLINGKLVHAIDSTLISFWELGFGVLAITVFLLVSDFSSGEVIFLDPSFFKLTLQDWLCIVVLASLCTAYAFVASVKVMKHLSPYTVMLTINLEPVYGILLAFLVLGEKEQMSPEFYYGALVILMVIVVNGVLKNHKKIKTKLEG